MKRRQKETPRFYRHHHHHHHPGLSSSLPTPPTIHCPRPPASCKSIINNKHTTSHHITIKYNKIQHNTMQYKNKTRTFKAMKRGETFTRSPSRAYPISKRNKYEKLPATLPIYLSHRILQLPDPILSHVPFLIPLSSLLIPYTSLPSLKVSIHLPTLPFTKHIANPQTTFLKSFLIPAKIFLLFIILPKNERDREEEEKERDEQERKIPTNPLLPLCVNF